MWINLILKTIKIAIVGAGQFSQCFVPLFQAHPLVSEVSLCESVPERLANARVRLGVSRTFSAFEEVLNDPAIDAVANFTQRWTHAPMAIRALKAGKHVYSAVPAATTLEELQSLSDYSQTNWADLYARWDQPVL